jgi:hypothetical protein
MANTPKGKLVGFVAIQTPSTKFDSDGVYSCDVAFEGDAAKQMKKTIDSLMKESLAETKGKRSANPPYRIEGKKLVVKFKQKARIKTRRGDVWEKEVAVYDSKAKRVEEDLQIGEGTEVIINYGTYFWNVSSQGAGVTLQLEAVQIIDLVKRTAGSASNPFIEVDGFTAADKATNPFDDDVDIDDDGDF